MNNDNEKSKNTAAIWAFWGVVIAALITAIVTLIINDKLPLFPTSQPASSDENVFTQDFDGSDGSFDPNIFECPVGNCNAQNVFQQNGSLVFKFNDLELSPEVWGTWMKSKATWKMKNLISLEGNLQISSNTKGGTFLGITDSAGCSLFAKPDIDTPSMHCDLGSTTGTTEYSTVDLPIKFDTWYLIRIDYDPTTQEQKYYLNNILIGQYMPKNLPDLATLSLGAWREENQSVNAFVDNIVVRTRP